jgi:hypothetical protein
MENSCEINTSVLKSPPSSCTLVIKEGAQHPELVHLILAGEALLQLYHTHHLRKY